MDITSFIIYCFIVTVTPGPTNIVILSTVHNYGAKKAMTYTYGATIAFGLLLGISAMLNTTEKTDNKTGTFTTGFLMQFLNPKVVLFAMTVIPSFVLPYYTDMPAVTISVIVITIIGLLAFIIWVLFRCDLQEVSTKA